MRWVIAVETAVCSFVARTIGHVIWFDCQILWISMQIFTEILEDKCIFALKRPWKGSNSKSTKSCFCLAAINTHLGTKELAQLEEWCLLNLLCQTVFRNDLTFYKMNFFKMFDFRGKTRSNVWTSLELALSIFVFTSYLFIGKWALPLSEMGLDIV